MAPLTDFQLSEGRYNARDVLATARLYKPLADALSKHNVVQVYLHDREMAKLALQMHRIGMPIDNAERERVGQHLRGIRDEAISELRKHTDSPEFLEWIATFQAAKARKADPQAGQLSMPGMAESKESAFAMRVAKRKGELTKRWERLRLKGKDSINLKSKVQQAALLRVAGVNLIRLTRSGVPKVSKDTLESHAHNPAARAMLNYGITVGIIKTFVEGLDVKEDGAIHPDWLIHKITGRWGSNPNVQNWSVRAGGGAENLRRMVCAPKGYVLVGADFSQLEARILAVLSRDPTLLEIFAQRQDIHAQMAAIGFPSIWPRLQAAYLAHRDEATHTCTDCTARKKLRDLTKRLEYGAFYGGAPQILHQVVVRDWPTLMLRDVESFVRSINSRMPAVLKWRQQVLLEATQTCEVRSPFLGRRETFPLGRVDPGVAFNYKAQSGGADLWVLGALAYCEKHPQYTGAGWDGRIIHNGHDSVLAMAKEANAERIAKDVKESFEREIGGVKFEMDVKIGERWSD